MINWWWLLIVGYFCFVYGYGMAWYTFSSSSESGGERIASFLSSFLWVPCWFISKLFHKH